MFSFSYLYNIFGILSGFLDLLCDIFKIGFLMFENRLNWPKEKLVKSKNLTNSSIAHVMPRKITIFIAAAVVIII